jgi:hypothetical protein
MNHPAREGRDADLRQCDGGDFRLVALLICLLPLPHPALGSSGHWRDRLCPASIYEPKVLDTLSPTWQLLPLFHVRRSQTPP